jgi:dnd system-associated protein 4
VSNVSGAQATPAIRRVRRPRDKDALLQQLTQEGPFADYRDALTFAAALGWYEQRRVPFEASSEPIRWDTMINRRGTEALVNMLAAADDGDPEILGDDRFEDRLRVFEEYANGGLEFLAVALSSAPRSARDIILDLVQKALPAVEQEEAPELAELAGELSWSTDEAP